MGKKVKLNLEDLKVTSFVTSTSENNQREPKTVVGTICTTACTWQIN